MTKGTAVVLAALIGGLALAGVAAAGQQPPRVTSGAKLHVDDTEFGKALAAAFLKKKLPVVAVIDREKADFYVTAVSEKSQEKTGERVAKVLVMGAFAGSGKSVEASVTVTNQDSVVVFAHNVRKATVQQAAENVADQLKKHIAGK